MAPRKITPVEGQAFVGDSLSDLIRAERLQVRSSLPQAHTQPYQRGQQHGASATQRPLQSLSCRMHMAPPKITPVEGQAFVGDSLSDLIRAERLQVRSSLPQAPAQPNMKPLQHKVLYKVSHAGGIWLRRKSPQLKDKPSSEILFQISSERNDCKSDPHCHKLTHSHTNVASNMKPLQHKGLYNVSHAGGIWLRRKSPQLKDKPSSEILFQISSERNDCKSDPHCHKLTHSHSNVASNMKPLQHKGLYKVSHAGGTWLRRKSPQLKDKPSSEILFQISSERNDCKSDPHCHKLPRSQT